MAFRLVGILPPFFYEEVKRAQLLRVCVLFQRRLLCTMVFHLGGKQLAAGRVLLGAPRTQMRGYCQQFSSGQGGHFHPEVQAFYNGIVFGGLPYLFWAHWQMWKIDQSSNEVYTERSMEIEKILKELS
uniref:Uncharacterized protein isoform X1 n=2 Tax=Nicotiana TaxID=4085 RepID=A0A1S4CJY7_TOBAC|nr:PREDICTED: uncharacterized protein LOC107819859 isoform X1 [Nicotiana tabacum]